MKKKDDNNKTPVARMISVSLGKSMPADVNPLENFDEDSTLVLPTRNLVLFPGIALPIQLGRETSIYVAEHCKKTGQPLAVFCQRDPDIETPKFIQLYETGTLARVIDIIELPNGVKTAIVEGLLRVRRIRKSLQKYPPGVICVRLSVLADGSNTMSKSNFNAIIDKIREIGIKLSKMAQDEMGGMQLGAIEKIKDPVELINTLAVHLPLEVSEKQEILGGETVGERAQLLLKTLLAHEEKISLMQEIMGKTRERMDNMQRNTFLQQQMEVIRNEIEGDEIDEVDDLEAQAAIVGLPEAVMERFDKEIRKLRRYNPQSPDYSVQYTYLETILSLPWNSMSVQNDSLEAAEQYLDSDHFGLKKIKERILEQVALIINNPTGQAPIICFVGPPGVGKTSLGQSIARALGREFQRVSFGGLHDEAEIRGHRRTYIGAMPGRIIEAMRRASTVNPVIMLDELDKIGKDYKGDPAAALLEVLDPAQNYRFHDNYIDVDYDLSKVLFIATANTLSTISKPLLDRIEVIELSGYSVEEKVEIAHRHLIPRLRLKHEITERVFRIDKSVTQTLIEEYTSESGVRQLENLLASLMRKKLLQRMRKPRGHRKDVTVDELETLLGPAPYSPERYEGNELPGVVTGLAWTSVGGSILLVEAATAPGKGELVLTGNLGDVMKESATLALEWVKVNSTRLGISEETFKNNNIHIHFPEGAIPKDGPSAGITIATAITSALTGRLLNPRIAMTGEITLRGKVLPVGGIKEKILAARRAGIENIILSAENRKNINDIEAEYIDGLNFIYVDTVDQVIAEALQKN